jgi:hypothetical protein
MTAAKHLALAFTAALDEPHRAQIASADAIEAWLRSSLEAARVAWPGVALGSEVFAGYLAAKATLLRDPSALQKLVRSRTLLVGLALSTDFDGPQTQTVAL